MAQNDPPTFDAERFAKWLRRWKEAEGLEWGEIAQRSGLGVGTIQLLARGRPSKKAIERGQTELNPGIATIARLAHGLGLEFGYVASKGGILGGGADRWEHFSKAERTLVHHALRAPTLDFGPGGDGGWEDQRQRLVHQLDQTLDLEVSA